MRMVLNWHDCECGSGERRSAGGQKRNEGGLWSEDALRHMFCRNGSPEREQKQGDEKGPEHSGRNRQDRGQNYGCKKKPDD